MNLNKIEKKISETEDYAIFNDKLNKEISG
jgi:hypothetical protein